MQSKMATSLGDRRSLGHYCPRYIYEIFMTTAIITPATISLYFVMEGVGRGGISERSLPLQSRNRGSFKTHADAPDNF